VRLAANYINFQVRGVAPRVEVVDRRRVALRFSPIRLSAWQWQAGQNPLDDQPRPKVSGRGAGYVEYHLALPNEIRGRKIAALELVVEASAKAGDEKLAWPARKRSSDYPQTDKQTQWPTDLSVSIAGQKVLATTLPDDPADARGVLSHVSQFQPGSYGWLVRATVDSADHGDLLKKIATTGRVPIRFEVSEQASHCGGLALFGAMAGRYPLDPTLIVTLAEDHALPSDFHTKKGITRDPLANTRMTVVSTARIRSIVWSYTTSPPPENWAAVDFDASGWRHGRSGFGRRGTPGARVNTNWHTADIWLRKEFVLPEEVHAKAGRLQYYHDEDIEIYLNGHRLATASGYLTSYTQTDLRGDQLRYLQPGRNVLAVHCRQTGGGQGVDVGLMLVR
jgi:hypothetical protein